MIKKDAIPLCLLVHAKNNNTERILSTKHEHNKVEKNKKSNTRVLIFAFESFFFESYYT
jgi:hypothetical protein